MLQNKGQLMALVCETLKCNSVLQQILTASNLQSLDTSLTNIYLTKILVYDALFGQGIKGSGKQEVSFSLLLILLCFHLLLTLVLDNITYCLYCNTVV